MKRLLNLIVQVYNELFISFVRSIVLIDHHKP